MIGAEIVIGVIIGVLFELFSDTEGTPLERESDSKTGALKNPFGNIEIAHATGITK